MSFSIWVQTPIKDEVQGFVLLLLGLFISAFEVPNLVAFEFTVG